MKAFVRVVKYIISMILFVVPWLVTAAIAACATIILVYGINVMIGGDTVFSLYVIAASLVFYGISILMAVASLSLKDAAKKLLSQSQAGADQPPRH